MWFENINYFILEIFNEFVSILLIFGFFKEELLNNIWVVLKFSGEVF